MLPPGHPDLRHHQAVRLRSISVEQAQFMNLLGRHAQLHLPDLEEGTFLGLEPAGPLWSAQEGMDASEHVVLRSPHGDLVLHAGLAFIRALSGIDLSADTQPERLQWWSQNALALLPEPMPQLFTKVLSGPHLPTHTTPGLAACLVLRAQDHVLSTHASAPWPVWRQLFSNPLPRTLRARHMSSWWSVLTQATVLAGTHHLSTHNFAQLRAGDTILIERPIFNTQGQGQIQWGPWQVQVSSEGGDTMQVTDVDMTDDEFESAPMFDPHQENALVEEAAADSEVANLGLVPVQLRFEMGVVSLSLQELNTLSSGTVIRLQGSVNPPHVAIRAGGQLVGRGELVDLDGKLGVQIVQWSGQ